jgi:hypothetical protein
LKHKHDKKNCEIYGNFQPGKPKFKRETCVLYDNKTPPINNLEGYLDLKQNLIKKFFSNSKATSKLMRIWGQAGVGKSALACHTVKYV